MFNWFKKRFVKQPVEETKVVIEVMGENALEVVSESKELLQETVTEPSHRQEKIRRCEKLEPFSSELVSKEEEEDLLLWYAGDDRTITQEEIAKRVGVTRVTLRKWLGVERSIGGLQLGTLMALIEVYNEDIARLEALEYQE